MDNYAHLLLTARTPLWYRHLQKSPADSRNFVVLRISPEVLESSDSLFSQWNPAGEPTFFYCDEISERVDLNVIHGTRFVDSATFKYQCSTQLSIFNGIPAKYILGAYVASRHMVDQADTIAPQLNYRINSGLFFGDKIQCVQKELVESERTRSLESHGEQSAYTPWNQFESWQEEGGLTLTDPRYTSDEFWDDDLETEADD